MDVYRWRWAVCSLIFIFLCSSDLAYSQTVTNKLEKAVTFSTRNVRLDTLLQTITRQTGIRFSYNSRRLNTSYRLHLNNTKLTVRQLLDKLKTATGVLYTVIENQVILNIDKSTVQRPVKPELKSPGIQPQPARSLAPAIKMQVPDSVNQVKPESSRTQNSLLKPTDSESVASDSLLTKDIVASATIPLSDSVSTLKSNSSGIAVQVKIDSTQKKETIPVVKKISPPKKQDYFLDLGVSAEETLFMGATLQGGIPSIFASLSVKSNGQSLILFYGLGTSIRIKDKSRIMLSAQYGSYSKSFAYTDTHEDSTFSTYNIGVKGSWIRAGAGMEWKINKRGNLKFYAGLNFNALESRYTVDGSKSGLNSIPVPDPERKFSAFYPFYTITNSFEDTASETLKTWVGIQVGINFTIFHR